MIIQNLNRKYIVLFKDSREEELEHFVCRDALNNHHQEYGITRIPHHRVSEALLTFLNEQSKNQSFSDFCEYFSDQSYLYIVMKETSYVALIDKLTQEGLSFIERLEIARRIFTNLVFQKAPDVLAYYALRISSIQVNQALDVYFQYRFDDFFLAKPIVRRNVEMQMAHLLEDLFKEELQNGSFKELDQLIEALYDDLYPQDLKVYEAFMVIYDRWIHQDHQELMQNRKQFQLWEKLKRLFAKLQKSVYIFVMLLAFVYLLLAVISLFQAPKTADVYERIGTLDIIKEGSDEHEVQ